MAIKTFLMDKDRKLLVVLTLALVILVYSNIVFLSTAILNITDKRYTALAFKPTNNTTVSKPVTINHPPVVKVGPDQTVNENATVMLVGFAFDPDPNDKLSYSWVQTAGPAVTLKGPDTATPTFVAPSNVPSDTQLKFALTAKDDKGAESNNPAIVTITVKHINRPPTANAGQDQTVNAGYIVTLDGTKSKDPDSDDTLTYSWVQTAGPNVTLNGADRAIATFTAPSNLSSDTDMTFELTVTDSKNATNTSTVKVTDKYIPPPNQPPTANAGSDHTVNSGDTVTLDGSGSRDPDGNITSYLWTQIAGPAVTLNGADTTTASFTAPSVSSDTTLKFSLTVKDDKGAASNNPAIVSVTVKAAAKPSGNMIAAPSINPNTNLVSNYQFVRAWGSNGTGDGLFNGPNDVAIDSSGNVYVADKGNNRIQKFDSNGNFITKWGSYGTGDGQFDNIFDVAIDSSGNVYVADKGNNRIQKFDSNGNFITKWGSPGNGDGQFDDPHSIAVDSSGNVYVGEYFNSRIQKFDSNGNFITKWGSPGNGDGQFDDPQGIAFDSSGNVYVADKGNNRIQKFDSNGNFITKWGSSGNRDGQFSSPDSLAFDSSGNVYVTDGGNNRIQKFDSNGNFITKWGSYGTGDGQFNIADDVAVDSSGNVYVADFGNNRIQVFSPSSTNINNISK